MNFQFDNDHLAFVPLANIVVSPYQPRKNFNLEELEELAASILSVGLLHPPLVRPLPEKERYELISGERRLRASRLAGLEKIPVYIRTTHPSISAQAALIENIQRSDLNPLDIARSLKRLMLEQGMNQEMLAKQLGKKRSTIANYLRLLQLPEEIQAHVEQTDLTMGHAKAILSLGTIEQQKHLADVILSKDLNVREAEKLAVEWKEKTSKKIQEKECNPHVTDLIQRLQERLGTRVSLSCQGNRGCISIDYYDLDDLDRLLSIFGIMEESL